MRRPLEYDKKCDFLNYTLGKIKKKKCLEISKHFCGILRIYELYKGSFEQKKKRNNNAIQWRHYSL